MPCYHPLTGYRSQTVNPSGKRSIVFNVREGWADMPIQLPCGQCIGCRLERSRIWAIRCVHESKMHEKNAFITLTYDNQHLPEDYSLRPKDFTDFMKRLREHVAPKEIRYFHCGEYGENFGRPHYHACIFGYDFPDKKPWKRVNDQLYWVSDLLKEKWKWGHSTIGDVTFESAAYVARYITKKITGNMAENYYEKINETTGEVHKLKPEYTTMSRRPGIGREWYDTYKKQVFPNDFVVLNGRKMRPPKYYFQQLEKEHEKLAKEISYKRQAKAEKNPLENSTKRLLVKEAVQKAQFKQLKRSYEK